MLWILLADEEEKAMWEFLEKYEEVMTEEELQELSDEDIYEYLHVLKNTAFENMMTVGMGYTSGIKGKIKPSMGKFPKVQKVFEKYKVNLTFKKGDKLPQQGSVSILKGHKRVHIGRQGQHVEGHKNYDPTEKSIFIRNADHYDLIEDAQKGWKHGRHPVTDAGEIILDRKIYETGRVIGTKGETRIDIRIDSRGQIHSFPTTKFVQ